MFLVFLNDGFLAFTLEADDSYIITQNAVNHVQLGCEINDIGGAICS